MTEAKATQQTALAKAKKAKPEGQGVKPWSMRLLLIYAGIGFYILMAWSQIGPAILSAIAFNLAVLAILCFIGSLTRTLVLRRILSLFMWGAFMTGVAVIISRAVVKIFAFSGNGGVEIVMAIVEEIVKLLPLIVLLIVGRRFSTFTMGMTDFLLAGAALGAGFSCLEYASAHKSGTLTLGQLSWLPTAEIINGRMVSGHLIWSSLAAAGIGFGFFFKTNVKVAAVGAAIGLAVSMLDHAAFNYSQVSNDWFTAALNVFGLNGYLAFGLWIASLIVAIIVDAKILIKAVPQFSEFKVPKGLEGLDGLMAMWDFVIDRRRLAYSLHHYANAPVTLKKDAAVTSSLLAQTLINFHIPERRLRTLDAMTREDLTLVSGINDIGKGDPDSIAEIDLPEHLKLIEPLSEGGMGIIYSGEHVHTGQKLAIKLLHPTFARQAKAVERFKAEARAVGALQHPNLVSVTDFGITERRKIPYLAMELIQGLNLEQLLKSEGGMAPARFFTVFDQVLDGLSHAHKRMVIHRDMKPSNILLTKTDDGRDFVKIVDFGIAKIMSGEGEEGVDAQELTRTGDLIGSPLYMSPEQGLGTKLDARSDIYSVGCVMYECITGNPPLMGTTAVQTIMMHINESPATMRAARPDLNIPAGIDFFVMKALAKNPSHRYQTMDEMREALHIARANPHGHTGGSSGQPNNPNSPNVHA